MTHLIVITIVKDRPQLITVSGAVSITTDTAGWRGIYAENGAPIVAVPLAGIVTHRITDEADAATVAAELRAEFQIPETTTTPANHDTL